MYTNVVKRVYKNVFCYICNENVNFIQAMHDLDMTSYGAIIGRASFYALIDFENKNDNEMADKDYVNELNNNNTKFNVNENTEECGYGAALDSITVSSFSS